MNKILLGLASASVMLFTTSASAYVMTAGIEAADDGDLTTWDLEVGDNTIFDFDADLFDIQAGIGGNNINISTADFNPFALHMGIISTETGTASFGVSLQGLTLADVASIVVEAGGAGFAAGTKVEAYIGLNDEMWGGTLIDSSVDFDWFSQQFDINASGVFSLQLIASLVNSTGTASMDVDMNIPEPSMLALMSLGLVGLGFAGRRKLK